MKRYVLNKVHKFIKYLSRRKKKVFSNIYSLNEINHRFGNRNQQYDYFHHYYWNLGPSWLREHRNYFTQELRGYGEDAFHSMWYFIFNEFKPKKVLEIGVYRGQTISLFSLLSKKAGYLAEIHALSPFLSVGDSVSEYIKEIDYKKDVEANFMYFKLSSPIIHEGFSTDDKMIKIIESEQWDLIYIDGNHDYNVVKHDFNVCSKNIRKNGLIVLDDASLNTDYKPSSYSTSGHSGPSKVASEIDLNLFEEIISVGHNRVYKRL